LIFYTILLRIFCQNAVAVAEKLAIIFIILNNQAFGMIKHRYKQTGTEKLEFMLPSVDFSQIAKGIGANGYIIHNCQDLKNLDYEAIYNNSKPTTNCIGCGN
jgi:acetolactate synthase-1/2/3 large subunit